MTVQTTTRNAGLEDLAVMLRSQQARKVDIVAPAPMIGSVGGVLSIKGAEPVIDDDGVTSTDGLYLPTAMCDEGIASKLDIPLAYLRRLRRDNVDLYDHNVNGWLMEDPRSFLVRCFKSDEGGTGIARAFLSDKYATMDNLDALMATLDGVKASGVDIDIAGCDLTDRRMVVRIECPQIRAMAPTLLAGYQSPFADREIERWRAVADREGMGYGGNEPVVFAGFVLANSETGGGAWSLTPRITVKVCRNGLTITRDAMRAVHLGGKLEEGTVNWSAETQSKAVDLVRSKTIDAVHTFLSQDYLTATVEAMEEKAGAKVKNVEAVKTITKSLKFTEEQTDGLLAYFVQGGQMTVGGVANAATAYAQEVADPEVAMALEAGAARLLVGA
jgi:hypothetical protein